MRPQRGGQPGRVPGYPYGQIAGILQSTEPAVRQLVSRARKHMTGERRAPVSPAAHRELLASFITAARSGDLTALERLFAANVTANGQACVVLVRNGDVFGVLAVTASAAGIDQLLWMVNPGKIAAVA